MTAMPVIVAISAAAVTLALVTAFAAGWCAGRRARAPVVEEPSIASRISLADLQSRMRRLEAIAAGIDV